MAVLLPSTSLVDDDGMAMAVESLQTCDTRAGIIIPGLTKRQTWFAHRHQTSGFDVGVTKTLGERPE